MSQSITTAISGISSVEARKHANEDYSALVPPFMLNREEEELFNLYLTSRASYDWLKADLFELAQICRLQYKTKEMYLRINWEDPEKHLFNIWTKMEGMLTRNKLAMGLYQVHRRAALSLGARRKQAAGFGEDNDNEEIDAAFLG